MGLTNRLIYQSWHRGMRELDLLLGPFAERHVPHMTEAELKDYDELLNEQDLDLFSWVTNQKLIPDDKNHELIQMIRNFH
jgi:antitoxin CptB